MSIQAVCSCGKQYWVDDKLGGKRARCPACGQVMDVPNPTEAEEVAVEDDAPAPAADRLALTEEPPPSKGGDLWDEPDRGAKQTPPARAAAEDDDSGAGYALTAESAMLQDRLPGQETGEIRVAGELGNYYLVDGDVVVSCVACSVDNEHILAGLEEQVHVLNLKTGKKAYCFEKHEDAVRCVAVSPDSRLALSGDEDGGLLLWDIAGRRALRWLEGHRRAVLSIAFAAHGLYAVSGGQDGTLRIWEVATGRQLARFEDRAEVTRAVFSPDGALILSGNGRGEVCLWDVARGGLLRELKGPALGGITSVSFTADGTAALAAGARLVRAGPPPVSKWDVARGRRLACFDEPTRNKTTIRCTAFSPDGNYLLAGGGYLSEVDYGGETRTMYTPVRLWSVEHGTLRRTFQGHMRGSIRWTTGTPLATIHCVAIAPDGRRGFSGGDDSRVEVWGLM
jgi:WD40 repeat protein